MLIILTSTYPRWKSDNIPRFVKDFAESMAPYFKAVDVLAPHYKNARHIETDKTSIVVKRFYYFWPRRFENIAYGDGGINRINFKNPIYLIKLLSFIIAEMFSVLATAIKNKNSIINAHWIIPQGFVAVLVGKLSRKKVIVTVHGSDVFALNSSVLKMVKRFTIKYADAVVVNSTATQKACQKIYARKKYPIIPMGINTSLFKKPKNKSKNNIFSILFVGRLSPEKGIMYLCEATLLLAKDGHNVELKIVGEGTEKSKVQMFIKDNHLEENIKLEGWQQPKKLVGYYQQADVLVSPSVVDKEGRQEAFGLVLAEAAACGLPIITSDVGGTKDIVRDGINGYFVPQKDPLALENKIRYLMENKNLREQMGKSGQELINEQYSWGSVAKKYQRIFKNL